jgi:hypothetical protein
MLIYLAGADDFYDTDMLEYGYVMDKITSPNLTYKIQPNVGHGVTGRMLKFIKGWLNRVINTKNAQTKQKAG